MGYWLEVLKDALSKEDEELEKLMMEATEITKIMSKAKSSTYGGNNH